MNKPTYAVCIALTLLVARSVCAEGAPTAQELVTQFLDSDPWGLGGAVLTAHAKLTDKRGSTSELVFTARSRRHDPPYSKSMVRFSAPADLAGAGFLQIQNRGADDDRFLFLPELKRSRRISGNLRGNSFMGTDFSFADLDRRDFRESRATSKPEENIGKFPCFHIESIPTRSDSPYGAVEVWLRKDNLLPLKMVMYDHAHVLMKTFTSLEVKRISGHWYVTKSKMEDPVHSHSTDLVLTDIAPATDIPDEDFTVRNLEKL
jgi:hypothetical protein